MKYILESTGCAPDYYFWIAKGGSPLGLPLVCYWYATGMPLVCHWESSSVLSNPSKSTNPVGLQRGRVPCPPQNAIGVAKIACLMSSSKTYANASKSHRRSKSENGSWFSRKPPLQPAPATAASVPEHLHCFPPPDDYYPPHALLRPHPLADFTLDILRCSGSNSHLSGGSCDIKKSGSCEKNAHPSNTPSPRYATPLVPPISMLRAARELLGVRKKRPSR